ncbi:hypothetical protein JD844_015257 [Phrynosoma platyrhinos]|uniref:ARF GTPase-activating protein GIT2 n=1 Tax=Phrynosoma platyrhinos TaxID=52577 RepID=A0ABQ7T7S9_PHRPL|nr:hypothetical protein JD844_015257 [Phrynosoma platyrhinos]
MVETLYNNGANSIWEHSLLDPASVMSGRRKANPQDKVQSQKRATFHHTSNGRQEYLQVRNALVASEAKIQQLMKVNVNLSDELKIMQKKTLQSENTTLRRQATTNAYPAAPGSEYADAGSHVSLIRRPSARSSSRPMSMYETGLSRKSRQRSAFRQGEGSLSEGKDPDVLPSSSLPGTEDVIRKTEQITKNIQELLRAAQENKHDRPPPPNFPPLISGGRRGSIQIFAAKPKSELVRTSLRLLTSSAYRLHSECAKALPPDSCPTADVQLVTQQVIQCAYDIAKAAKQLVTITTKENTN